MNDLKAFRIGFPVPLLLLALGCSGSVGDRRPTALLGTTLADTPWPNDRFLAEGRLRVGPIPFPGDPRSLADLTAALGEMDGAPVRTSIFFPTEGGSLPAGALPGAAQILDLTAGGPAEGAPQGMPLFYRADEHLLVAMTPEELVFHEGHRYAAVVGPEWARPSPAMAEALRGRGPEADVYAPLVAALEEQGLNRTAVGAATVFTVGHPSRLLFAMRSELEATPPPVARVSRVFTGAALDDFFGHPTTTRSGLGDPGGVVHDAVGWVVEGTFDAPYYLTGGGDRLGRIVLDDSGAPVPQGVTTIPFLLTIPKDEGQGLGRTPLLIFQHGLNNSRVQVAAVGNDYARAGFATIGMDSLWHGDRRPGAADHVYNLTNAPGSDGLADPDPFSSSILFFNLAGDPSEGIDPIDGRPVRDNLRESALEICQLVRLVREGDLSAVARADPGLAGLSFDGSNLVYTGESFGSIMGALVLAVDPGLKAAVLSVGGAGIFLPIFPDSPWFSQLTGPILESNFDRNLRFEDPTSTPGETQESLSLLQAVLEPGDPVAFARFIAREPAYFPKSLLLLQAMSDEIIPNQGGELLAAAAGATDLDLPGHTHPLRYAHLPTAGAPLTGNLNGATVAVANMNPATHGMYTLFHDRRLYQVGFPPFVKLNPVQTIDEPIEYDHALAIGFAETLAAQGVPSVVRIP